MSGPVTSNRVGNVPVGPEAPLPALTRAPLAEAAPVGLPAAAGDQAAVTGRGSASTTVGLGIHKSWVQQDGVDQTASTQGLVLTVEHTLAQSHAVRGSLVGRGSFAFGGVPGTSTTVVSMEAGMGLRASRGPFYLEGGPLLRGSRVDGSGSSMVLRQVGVGVRGELGVDVPIGHGKAIGLGVYADQLTSGQSRGLTLSIKGL